MDGERVKILVEVNLDPVLGRFNEPADFVALIQSNLDNQIPHYKPTVKHLEMTEIRSLTS